jgi:phospholipase C
MTDNSKKITRDDDTKIQPSPLLLLIPNGKFVDICEEVDKGHNYKDCDSDGNTALHLAAKHGKVKVLSLLLSRIGKDAQTTHINSVNGKGDSVLWLACEGESLPCVRILVTHGASKDDALKKMKNDTSYVKKDKKREISSYMTKPIQHVIVLMLENRSFDNIFGCMEIEGVKSLDPEKFGNARFITQIDPGHESEDVKEQLKHGFVKSYEKTIKKYRHTVGKEILKLVDKTDGNTPQDIEQCFTPEKLPVISKLAKSFCISTEWYCNVPGPTIANRMYVHCESHIDHTTSYKAVEGVSKFMGEVIPIIGENATLALNGVDHPTIEEALMYWGKDWRVFYHDGILSEKCNRLANEKYREKFQNFATLSSYLNSKKPANFIFIEPRYNDDERKGKFSNDMHPPGDVRDGELLIADTYEMIRSSPIWDQCLFIITFDEHGGFSERKSESGFGYRVPAVLISPYIKK